LKQYTPCTQIKQTLHTQPGVTYAQVTKQTSYAATNIEQDQHTQTQFLNKNKNDCIQTFLQGLPPTESTDYSLWKATKKIKQGKRPSPPIRTSQGTWARSNIEKAYALLNT
jgi:hypothetical protein